MAFEIGLLAAAAGALAGSVGFILVASAKVPGLVARGMRRYN
jgi:hypothetical protein